MNKREYIQANKDWLMAKSKEEGVNALSKGIYYKVLSEGNPDPPVSAAKLRTYSDISKLFAVFMSSNMSHGEDSHFLL